MNPAAPTPIAAIFSKLVPFRAIADDADCVIVQPGQVLAPFPTFQVMFGKLTPAIPAVADIPAIPQKSGPNLPDYQPAVPAVPGRPAVPAHFDLHRSENITLTQEEWDNWDKGASDNDYVLAVVAKRFGQTLNK